jgi:hypothetical protein
MWKDWLRRLLRFAAIATAGNYAAGLIATGISIAVSAVLTYLTGISGTYGALIFVGLALGLTGMSLLLVRRFLPAHLLPAGTRIDFVSVRLPPGPPKRRKRSLKEDDRYVRGDHLLLAEIARYGDLSGRTFEDCDIYGPAIIFPLENVQIVQPTFDIPDGVVESMLWDRDLIQSTRKTAFYHPSQIGGVVRVTDCRFIRCRFHQIGFFADQATWAEMMRQWGDAFDVVS